jgi:type ISP restriction-modification system protein/N-6 DNA methylase
LVQKATDLTIEAAVASFGQKVKDKLSNPAVTGQPEDQLRAPLEQLITDVAAICNFPTNSVVAVGESALSELKTRPDYSVTVYKALVGFIEVKAPGKGADPRKFKEHDKEQWEKLRSLPNILYTDGNSFSLWRSGDLFGKILTLIGDIESSGSKLEPPVGFANLFEEFLRWKPIPPKSAKELAQTTARLCRLLRDEVTEQLALNSEALTSLATDWRKLLFPDATNERFADGYAQAVTFGMLMARAKKISLSTSLHQVAEELSKTSSLIGAALRLLTDNVETQQTLKTALGTLTRVLDGVDWGKISKGDPDAWLYFYEDFLAVYDNDLRKLTGSYYTPPEVVQAMVGLVHEALCTPRFGLHQGLAAPTVTLADPAVGTGTFVLGVLRKIADAVSVDQGEGAIKGAVQESLERLIAFEMQLGPFSVAQLRIAAEILQLAKTPPKSPVRMFVTNTLGNPYDDEGWIPGILAPIAESRKQANKIKRDETITVVIGNPPYKEKAKGRGGWVETAAKNAKDPAPLATWFPPTDWGVGAHVKHLRNLYVYFWRWATWKVFDHGPGNKSGIVCFITVAGFLNGPGFQKMRDYLRRTCDDIWVIDCSPEGHQPEVNTRIFQGVQQPVCIVLASRSAKNSSGPETPAKVMFQSLPLGKREEKFKALAETNLKSTAWIGCPSEWRAPFLPASTGAWATFPALEDLFIYNGSGVMPGRTWIIAPDSQSLKQRWSRLAEAVPARKELLFHPHLRNGEPGDKHSQKVVADGLPGFPPRLKPVADDSGACVPPTQYAFRSFDRQWIIPDNRLINQPNPELWKLRSDSQVYLTAPSDRTPTNGPALTLTALIPDLHHYGGRGGRVFPLWRNSDAGESNFRPKLLAYLQDKLGAAINGSELMAYIAAVAAHPAFTARFQHDLSTPGLRIPITAEFDTFKAAMSLGYQLIWLHTFGDRMTNDDEGRPAGPPRLPVQRAPYIPANGTIPSDKENMPDSIEYDAGKHRLLVGHGYVENVPPEVWAYQVSGKQVLTQWFSYRKSNRERPIIGDRRPPSPLGDIQPDHWLPEYTTELINVLNVLALLVELEPAQKVLLEKICSGPLISEDELRAGGALELPPSPKKKKSKKQPGPKLFAHEVEAVEE